MTTSAPASQTDLVDMAAAITAAYVTNNRVKPSEIAAVLTATYTTLARLGAPTALAGSMKQGTKATLAQVNKSITPEGLVSFVNGKTYLTLKRHLAGHGLTPKAYRERYGLPANYPMVAATYSQRRSDVAKQTGLGQNRRKDLV